jgi:hypothetical protein
MKVLKKNRILLYSWLLARTYHRNLAIAILFFSLKSGKKHFTKKIKYYFMWMIATIGYISYILIALSVRPGPKIEVLKPRSGPVCLSLCRGPKIEVQVLKSRSRFWKRGPTGCPGLIPRFFNFHFHFFPALFRRAAQG